MTTHRDHHHGTTAALAALAAVLVTGLVSGCGGTDGGIAQPTSTTRELSASTSPSATSPSSAQSADAPQPVAPPAPPDAGPGGVPECKVSDLRLELGRGEGAAGTAYRPLLFTNVGGRTCFTHGFPGVSYVAGADGHQVGPAAVREGEKGDPVTLAPGQVGFATIGFVNVRNYEESACQPTLTTGLRIYPPQETRSIFVPMDGAEGCAATPPGQQLSVRAIRPGTGP